MQPVLREGSEFEDLKSVLQNLDFESNFNAKKVRLDNIPNGDFKFPHGLNTAPSGRIIIKQISGGVVTDSETPWDDKYIYMNNAGTTIKSLIMIVLR